MGRLLKPWERKERVDRAASHEVPSLSDEFVPRPSNYLDRLKDSLDLYFSVCAISRGKDAGEVLKTKANSFLFSFRLAIEREIFNHALDWLRTYGDLSVLLSGGFFGCSKKQGTSLRLPLTTCQPTSLCAPECYAHDVLDAAPYSVIRGALNGVIGQYFTEASNNIRQRMTESLQGEVRRAVRSSLNELKTLPAGYSRPAYIRFAHVGEAAEYPDFSNALAESVHNQSKGLVQSVVYTRHHSASLFDPNLFVVNFTLDAVSHDRSKWIPSSARRVYSAFGGVLDSESEINFLEHHRWFHARPKGKGIVCMATHPDSPVHTCDAVRCHKCFVPK